MPNPTHSKFSRTIEKVGGVAAAARIIGCSYNRLQYHVKNGKVCPAWAVRPLAKAAKVPLTDLRPDLY